MRVITMTTNNALVGVAKSLAKMLSDRSKQRLQRILLAPEEVIIRPEYFPSAIGLHDEHSADLRYASQPKTSNILSKSAPDLSECISILRNEKIEKLRNAAYLENELLPLLGLNNENFREFPRHLAPCSGHGLKIWQYPNQLAHYLASLADKEIRSYLEIGVRHGGTFILTVEYLSRFSEMEAAVGVDIESTPSFVEYAEQMANVTYVVDSSTSAAVKAVIESRKWDLALIDGDHTFGGCLRDFTLIRNHAKCIALHDIISDSCPGVRAVWRLVSNVVPNDRIKVYVDQYEDVFERTNQNFLGIGLIDFGSRMTGRFQAGST